MVCTGIRGAGIGEGGSQTHKRAIRMLYGGQGINIVDAIAANLRRASPRTAATPGSDTASKALGLYDAGLAPHGGKSAGTVATALVAEHAGEAVSHGLGPLAMISAVVAKHVGHAMKHAGIKSVNDLTVEALLHPTTVASELLARTSSGGLPPMAQRRLARTLQAITAADLGRQVNRE